MSGSNVFNYIPGFQDADYKKILKKCRQQRRLLKERREINRRYWEIQRENECERFNEEVDRKLEEERDRLEDKSLWVCPRRH